MHGYVTTLSDLLSRAWLNKAEYAEYKSQLDKLCDSLYKVKEHLRLKQKLNEKRHHSSIPCRTPQTDLRLRTVAALQPTDKLKQCYEGLWNAVEKLSFYEPVSLLDFEPEDRYQRRHWNDDLMLPCRIMMYIYGNYMGTYSKFNLLRGCCTLLLSLPLLMSR